MKVQIAIVVEQLRMQLIDQMRGLLDATGLHRFADQNAIVQRVERHRWLDARFELEFLGGVFDSL